MGGTNDRRLLVGLVAAFCAVALAFIVASLVAHHASTEIDRAAADLMDNALPSVTNLMNARSELRRLDVEVDALRAARPSTRVEQLGHVEAARAAFEAEMRAEMATPWYPGEHELFDHRVQPRIAELDRTLGLLRDAVQADPNDDRRLDAARAQVDSAVRGADAAVLALAELNHSEGYAAASHIINVRVRAARLSFWLDVVSSLIAIAAAALSVGAARRFARVWQRNAELESQRANELDVFAQRVAHDLLSPMAAITLSLHSIERAHPDAETIRAIDRARRALERSRQMVHGIYAFSGAGARPAEGASAPLRATTLAAIDGLLAAETGSPPVIDVEPFPECSVACDAAVLNVMVTNLVSNAMKFTRDSQVRRVTVRAFVGDKSARVEVEDTGPGLPPGFAKAAFEPYRRAPGVTQPGLGLGLATVKRIAVAHGGAVGARNAPSGGAIVWFELPRAPEAHAEAAPREPTEPVPPSVH